MFDDRKVAQAAAYFLHRRGGEMSHLKLMKLLYLADRESMRLYGEPISQDRMVSMPHGPVLSQTYDLMSGCSPSSEDGWESWIADVQDHQVKLRRDVNADELLYLSESEIEILDQVWQRYGGMTRWQIRDYTHDHCSEWEDPKGSSKPLKPEAVFRALGRTPEEARQLAQDLQAKRQVDELFDSL